MNYMSSIPEYMTQKHRDCDDVFTEAESAVAKKTLARSQLKVASLYERFGAAFGS